VRARLGERVVEVRLQPTDEQRGGAREGSTRSNRSPHELFKSFLGEAGYDDDRIVALFDRLLDAQSTV
jgi:hypothetical protein